MTSLTVRLASGVSQRLADPPLDPSGAEARSRLRRELLRPEYHQQDVLQRLMRWLERRLLSGLDAASNVPALSTLAGLAVFVALALALGWLISRARRTVHTRERDRSVLTAELVSAAELRARADAALAAGRYEEVVVDGFRALTVRQVERGRLGDSPGATAHEVSSMLATEYPLMRERLGAGALVFDAVLYGERPADRAQAEAVLALDDDLMVRR